MFKFTKHLIDVTVSGVHQVTACTGETLPIECSDSEVLRIISASYGHHSNDIRCLGNQSVSSMTCGTSEPGWRKVDERQVGIFPQIYLI